MLSILGSKHRFCDGINRRSFLQIGGLGLGGMSLSQILQAQALASNNGPAEGSSRKSIIMIYLAGGISHQDFVDLKPNAPAGIRGAPAVSSMGPFLRHATTLLPEALLLLV